MTRTPDQIKELIQRSKALQKSWKAEAVKAKEEGYPMLADACLAAVENHKRTVIVLESELEAMR